MCYPLNLQPSLTLTLDPMQVLVDNPDNLEKIRERESDLTKERINLILATGANVVLTTQVRH